MEPTVFLIVSFCSIFSQVTAEYCWYHEAIKSKDDYISCEFSGDNEVLEGISLLHVKYDTTIPVLKKSLLSPYKNLKTLYITAANVQRIEPGALDSFQLEMVDFYNNKLKTIENGTFNSLSSLKFLDLSYNKFESLEAYTFKGLTSLEWLSLNSNRLKAISNRTFAHLKNLRALYLQFNEIGRLGVKTFENLIDLEVLSLSFNSLNKIEVGLLADQRNMKTLHLQHNLLENLPSHVFDNATSLTELDISENNIKVLQENLFNRTKELEILKFSSNGISELNSTVLLSHTPKLTQIYLFHNQWKCENLKEMVKDLDTNCVYIATTTPVLAPNEIRGIGCMAN